VKLREVILKERNKEVTDGAISHWFARHPDVKAELEKEIIEEQLPLKEVDESIFENGTFEELKSVKNWIQEMEDRHLDKQTMNGHVGALKGICKRLGLSQDEWTFKHPDRLTLDEARDYIRKRREKGLYTHSYRLAARDFLLSKGITAGKKISGATESGKYKKLHLPPEIEQEFLEGVKSLNFEAYAADLFERKTGTRVNATLKILIEDISEPRTETISKALIEGKELLLTKENEMILKLSQVPYKKLDEQRTFRISTVFDKAKRSIHPEGHEWKKYVDMELWEVLQKIIEGRQVGKVFSITKEEVRKINSTILREMIQKHANEPKIVELLKMCLKLPTHWLRHQFYQRCLHQTRWNYGACAALGGSTVKSLEESYGAPPDEMVKQWGLDYIPQI